LPPRNRSGFLVECENMEQATKKPNKPMFWIGIVMIVITVILLLTGKEELGMSPIIIGIIGVVFIGASQYRPMK